MSAQVVSLLVVLAFAAGGCSGGAVSLKYRFPAGRVTRYVWTIEATTTADLAGRRTTRRVRMVVAAGEAVRERLPGGGARLLVTLTPREVSEDGIARGETRSLAVEMDVAPTGRVVGVRGATDLPPGALAALEVDRLLLEARPYLARNAVRIGDRWASPLVGEARTSALRLEGEGRLTGFALEGRRRLARVLTQRTGTIATSQAIGRVRTALRGTTTVATEMALDLDEGLLVSAVTHSTSHFDLSLAGGEPAGKLHVRLLTRVRLAD